MKGLRVRRKQSRHTSTPRSASCLSILATTLARS